MKKILFLSLVSAITFAQTNITKTLSQIENIGETITVKKLKEHITVLASDSLEGREVGKPGETMAAEYMSKYFKELGIPPYKDSTYYQNIPLEERVVKNATIKVNENEYEYKLDFYTYPNFGQTKIESESVLFLGYGIDS